MMGSRYKTAPASIIENGAISAKSGTRLDSGLEFSPSMIAGLQLWLAADDLSTINAGSPVDGVQVNTWGNKGPGINDAVQASSTNQPIWRDSGFGVNSTPYLDFDGVNDYLMLLTLYSKPAEYTAYAVFEHDTNNSVAILADLRSNGDSFSASVNIRVEGGVFRNQFGDASNNVSFINSTETFSFNTPYTVESKYITGNQVTEMWSNGVGLTENLIGASPASSIGGTPRGMSVGRLGDFNGRYLNGKVAEILLYDVPLVSDDQDSIRQYLRNKYATY